MTEAVGVQPGDKALEVGAGSGYQAAILAHLGAKVYALERNRHLQKPPASGWRAWVTRELRSFAATARKATRQRLRFR